MIYKMNRTQFNNLGGKKEEVIKFLNANLSFSGSEQTSTVVYNPKLQKHVTINFKPIRAITDIVIT